MLLIAIVAGLLLGAVGGAVGALVLRYAPDDLTAILASPVSGCFVMPNPRDAGSSASSSWSTIGQEAEVYG
jgi:hypothetical protein